MTKGATLILAGMLMTSSVSVGAPRPDARKHGDEVAALATQLADADMELAARAVETLGASSDPAAHDAILDGLAFGMPPQVATVAVAALALHPAPPDVPALERYAAHRNPNVRAAALAALALYPSPEAHASVVAGLHDTTAVVRAAAAAAAAKGRVRLAIPALFELLARGEEPAGKALASMADTELAAKIADHLGQVPDPMLAQCLGLVLRRPDFGPDTARVEVVRALAKISDRAATVALADYVENTPKNPPRASRLEAERVIEARNGGGK